MGIDGAEKFEDTQTYLSTVLIYYIHKMCHCSSKSLFVEFNLANKIRIAGIFSLSRPHTYPIFRIFISHEQLFDCDILSGGDGGGGTVLFHFSFNKIGVL